MFLSLFWLPGTLITPLIFSIMIRLPISIVSLSKFYQKSGEHVHQ